MGRRARRLGSGRRLPVPPVPPADRIESWADGDWVVRTVSGASATKTYRCPGCDQEILPGTPHLVVWAQHVGLGDRRHWHAACWARDRRAAGGRRSGG